MSDALLQLEVTDEVARCLVEVRRDGLHREHAIGQQREILPRQSPAAAEHAPQPMIERLCESNSMPRLSHLGAAGESVAGPVDVFRDRVGLREGGFLGEVGANGCDVRAGLARVDLTQNFVRSILARRNAGSSSNFGRSGCDLRLRCRAQTFGCCRPRLGRRSGRLVDCGRAGNRLSRQWPGRFRL